MGMAAGQARLLSITSRMSDNELRAQIINNNKMRLASESSQVSEAYIAALNEAQLMFTNYDADNNMSFKELTFNALTSYNPYNNQYALINSSGQILISEFDANNYQRANGSLDEFLKLNGLEKTTSYFDVLPTLDGYATYTDYNSNGNLVMEVSSGFTPEALKAAYYGEGDTIPFIGGDLEADKCGYDKVLNSPKMFEYTSALSIYSTKKSNYLSLVSNAMNQKLDELIKNKFSGIGVTNYNQLIDKVSAANNQSDINNLYGQLASFFKDSGNGNLKSYATDDGSKLLDEAAKTFTTISSGEGRDLNNNTYNVNEQTTINEITQQVPDGTNPDGTPKYKDVVVGYNSNLGNVGGLDQSLQLEWDANKNLTSVKFIINTGSENSQEGRLVSTSPYTFEVEDANGQTHQYIFELDADFSANSLNVLTKSEDSLLSKCQDAVSVLSWLKNNLANVWDITNPVFGAMNADSEKALGEFIEAGNELYRVIYGANGSYSETNTSGPPPLIKLDDIAQLYNKQDEYGLFDEEFKPVFMNIVLDNVMDTYGEPKTTWINKYDPNDNSEKRAQWYTNLFNRIERSGYHTLKDGLASSPEWIKFAFESGIVVMEQVDSFNTWNQLIYTNCSDITEQTKDKAVTIAEAEYNAAMNKIENKDKRYDLELKNIDTEHNSLQTEYDSIKAALDKHIERTFKYMS